MIWINTEDVICIHNRIIEKTKGIEGIRDLHGLEAAIAAPLQTFSGQDLFPTDTEKIARLGYGLAANHAFLDGNKRIGAEQLAFKFRIGVGELRVLRANHTKQAQCCFKWAESSAICYMNLDSAAALAAEFCAVRRIKGFAEQAAFVGQKGKRMDCIPDAEPRTVWQCRAHRKGLFLQAGRCPDKRGRNPQSESQEKAGQTAMQLHRNTIPALRLHKGRL